MSIAAPASPSVIRFDRSQRRLFEDQSRVIAVNFHRQKGKDFTAACKAVSEAIQTGQNWFIVAMTQSQADETFAKCKLAIAAMKEVLKRMFGVDDIREEEDEYADYDREIDHTFQARARHLILPNGARVVSLPGRDPDSLAGRTGNQIWTEFGLFKGGGYAHWSVLFPIITRGAYKLVVISTPRGKNTKFYEVMQNPDGLYSTHFCDIYQSVYEEGYQLFDAKGQPFPQSTREEQELAVATFRKMYADEAKWAREYECQFTGDSSALIPWHELERAAAIGADLPFDWVRVENDESHNAAAMLLEIKSQLAAGARVETGWDVARRGHLSVISLNLGRPNKPKHLRFMLAMKGCSFDFQRGLVRACMDLQRYSVGRGDATGLGMESNETLERLYRYGKQESRWQPHTFTATGKREVASALRTAFADGHQSLPPMSGPHKHIATDLYAIQADDSGAQLVIDEAPNPLLADSHCDQAYSIGLARLAGAMRMSRPLPVHRGGRPIGL